MGQGWGLITAARAMDCWIPRFENRLLRAVQSRSDTPWGFGKDREGLLGREGVLGPACLHLHSSLGFEVIPSLPSAPPECPPATACPVEGGRQGGREQAVGLMWLKSGSGWPVVCPLELKGRWCPCRQGPSTSWGSWC